MRYKKHRAYAVITFVVVFLIGWVFCIPRNCNGQDINIDSIQAFVNDDKNCTDFRDRQSVQSHFEALDIILSGGEKDLDPHGLDRDGNGYACEGKQYVRWLQLASDTTSTKLQIRTVETVHSVQCYPEITGWINITEYSNKMQNAPFNQIEYMPSLKQAECIDTLFEVYNYNPDE